MKKSWNFSSGAGSSISRNQSADPDPYQNEMDPQHWTVNSTSTLYNSGGAGIGFTKKGNDKMLPSHYPHKFSLFRGKRFFKGTVQ